jgi:hypothetical protein
MKTFSVPYRKKNHTVKNQSHIMKRIDQSRLSVQRFGSQSLMRLGALGVAALLFAAIGAIQPAHAALDFTGPFDPANWSLTPDGVPAGVPGQVTFLPAVGTPKTQLFLAGPGGLVSAVSGLNETAVYLGAPVAETVTFNWSFKSQDASSATAEIGTKSGFVVLASGGPGTLASGTYSLTLAAGDQFAFLLSSDMVANKTTSAQFLISGFSYSVPEASTVWAGVGSLGLAVMSIAARRSRPKTSRVA